MYLLLSYQYPFLSSYHLQMKKSCVLQWNCNCHNWTSCMGPAKELCWLMHFVLTYLICMPTPFLFLRPLSFSLKCWYLLWMNVLKPTAHKYSLETKKTFIYTPVIEVNTAKLSYNLLLLFWFITLVPKEQSQSRSSVAWTSCQCSAPVWQIRHRMRSEQEWWAYDIVVRDPMSVTYKSWNVDLVKRKQAKCWKMWRKWYMATNEQGGRKKLTSKKQKEGNI